MNQKLDLDFYGENCKNIVKLFLEQKKTECDVCLMGCDGTIIKSHKIILSACSSYFNCVLSKFQNNQEKDLVLLMPAYTEKEIRGVLNFIYNGKLPENDKDDRPSYDRLISIANELKVVGMAQSIELLSKLIPKMLDVKEFEKQLMEKESDKSSSIEISKYDEANRKAAKVLKSTKDFPGWMMRFKRDQNGARKKDFFTRFNDIFNNQHCSTMSNQNIFIISIIGIPFYGINKIETIKTIFKTLFDEVPCKISTPDQIQELILNTFNSFMSFDHFHREFKVIAGIVKVGQDTTELVSLGTGSKFLNDKLFEGNGNTLIDSHAEVLARRGFMRYLFYELRKSIQSPKSSIFIRDEANNNRFKLKKGISFHLYISTAPCGDGRVYSHCETNYRSPADIREGVLRYKGEESLTVLKDASKENDVKNPISMSCSAKIMKWNVLGLQGGLLAKYISPVYLTSIIIGNKFDKIHLERALYARIEHQLQSLPETYALHKPELLEVTQKASNPNNISNIAHSCNWFSPGKYGIEILNATNGKTENKQFSQLSKRALLHEFVNFGALLKENDIKTDYNSAKMSSNEYIEAKRRFLDAIKTSDIGTWIEKTHNYTILCNKKVP